ncbi:Multidrug resistance protein MdtG [subsurface metagenome]
MNFGKIKEEVVNIFNICVNTKNITLLILAGSIYMMVGGMLRYILPVYFKERGASFVGLGFIYSLSHLIPAIIQPIMGWLSDRIGRRKIIIGSVFLTSTIFPMYMYAKSTLGLGVVHSLRNITERASTPALDAMIGDVTSENERATVISVYGSITALAFVIGSLLSYLVLRFWLGYKGLFYIASISCFLSSIVLFFKLKESIIRNKVMPKKKVVPNAFINFVSEVKSYKKIIYDRSLRGLFLYHFFFSFALIVYPIYFPILAREVIKVEIEMIPLLGLIGWLVYALTQPFAGRISDKMGKRKPLIAAGLLLSMLSKTMLGFSSSLTTMLVSILLLEIAHGIFRPVASALIVDILPAHERGKYFGMLGSTGVISFAIAPFCYAFLANYSIRFVFILATISYLLALISIIVLVTEKKKE